VQGEKNANQTIKPSHGVFLQSALCARQRLCVGLSRLPFASRAAVPCAPLLGPRAACCAHGPAARRVALGRLRAPIWAEPAARASGPCSASGPAGARHVRGRASARALCLHRRQPSAALLLAVVRGLIRSERSCK